MRRLHPARVSDMPALDHLRATIPSALVRNRQSFLTFTVDLMNALGGGWQGA